MFPTAGSSVYYNEDGEVLGWDNEQYFEPPESDPGDDWGPEQYWDDEPDGHEEDGDGDDE